MKIISGTSAYFDVRVEPTLRRKTAAVWFANVLRMHSGSSWRHVRHIGFDRKCILTIPRPTGIHNAPAYQISEQSQMYGRVIDDSTNFPARFSNEQFCDP